MSLRGFWRDWRRVSGSYMVELGSRIPGWGFAMSGSVA